MQTHPGEVRRADPDWGNDKDYVVRVTPKDRIDLKNVIKSNSKYSRGEDDASRKMLQKIERMKDDDARFARMNRSDGWGADVGGGDIYTRKQKANKTKRKPVRKVAKKKPCKR